MVRRVIAFIVLIVCAGGVVLLAPAGDAIHASPQFQGRDTPTPELPATDVPPTDVPPTDVPPTDVPPTDVPPTDEPKPTSKPKSKKPRSESEASTPVPVAPTAALDEMPTTGFGRVGGWTLGITGLVLVCLLVVVRRLRMGRESERRTSAAVEPDEGV